MGDSVSIDFTRVFDIISYQQKKYPQTKALNSVREGQWFGYSIGEVQEQADNVSCWMLGQGLSKGDRIALVPKMGSPEWMITDFACQQIGLIVVPIHPTSSIAEMEFIITETEAKACIVTDLEFFTKVRSTIEKIPKLVYLFHLQAKCPDLLPPFENKYASPNLLDELKSCRDQIYQEDTLAILYTSGTSGTPKGAILSHGNVVSNIKSILTLLPLAPGHRVLSFLPFSHIFERTSCYAYMALGVSIHFSKSIDRLSQDFNQVKPFFCTCVPRTLEKMYDLLLEQRQEKGFILKRLIEWAMDIGEKYKDSDRTGIYFRFKLFTARLLVLNKWRKALGGQIRYMAVGAAALRPEIGRLFSAAGVMTLSGYGMTEASPFISVNRFLPGLNRFGTVGIPVPGVEIRFDNPNENGEGEILVRGPNIMKGYYKRPEMTREVLSEDGWLRTGDVGRMVGKRFLTITDRKKDIFKTSSGKYVAPQPLENHFASSPFVTQCLAIGFNRPYVTAILIPHFQILKTWCEEHGIHWTSPQYMVHNIKVIKKYQDEVERLNEPLQGFERVRSFILSDEEWTVENKDLTTSFKPMRNKLLEKHKVQIEKLYM